MIKDGAGGSRVCRVWDIRAHSPSGSSAVYLIDGAFRDCRTN